MNKVYGVITDRILEQLDKGTVPWQRPWTGGESKNLISKKGYRGINVFLLACQGYASPYWVSYKQAQGLGGNVKKGEKGTPVVFWKTYKRKAISDDGEETERPGFVLRYYTVFNVDQCEGIDGKVPETEKHEVEPIEICDQVVKDMPNKPRVEHGEPQAYYRPITDTVNMPNRNSFVGSEEYYSTLFHELTHSTGHDDRLGRHKKEKCSHAFGSADYSKEELVAEMGAAFLCGHTAIVNKTIDNSAAYIDNWCRKFRDKPQMVVLAAAQAQKAADYIKGVKYE